MQNVTVLAHLGLFVRPGFLSTECCRQIRREMIVAARVPAMVRPMRNAGGVLDQTTCRTGVASMSASTVQMVEDRLRAAQPALEEHFRLRLAGGQAPRFYIYDSGDFFLPHQDRDAEDPVAPDWIKARQVSVSIFLSDVAAGLDAEPHGGGALVFYGRRADQPSAQFGVPAGK